LVAVVRVIAVWADVLSSADAVPVNIVVGVVRTHITAVRNAVPIRVIGVTHALAGVVTIAHTVVVGVVLWVVGAGVSVVAHAVCVSVVFGCAVFAIIRNAVIVDVEVVRESFAAVVAVTHAVAVRVVEQVLWADVAVVWNAIKVGVIAIWESRTHVIYVAHAVRIRIAARNIGTGVAGIRQSVVVLVIVVVFTWTAVVAVTHIITVGVAGSVFGAGVTGVRNAVIIGVMGVVAAWADVVVVTDAVGVFVVHDIWAWTDIEVVAEAVRAVCPARRIVTNAHAVCRGQAGVGDGEPPLQAVVAVVVRAREAETKGVSGLDRELDGAVVGKAVGRGSTAIDGPFTSQQCLGLYAVMNDDG
jgi:hypothetical protein